MNKNESLSNFDLLRKEVLNLIPSFTKLNELPSLQEKILQTLLQVLLVRKLILNN